MYFRHFHIWWFPSFGSRTVLEPKQPTNQERARKASHYDLLWFSVHEWILTRSMLPVVANTLCCEVPPCFTFRMPRVVPDQRDKFENDELFRKLSRETEVRRISAALPPGSFSTRVRVRSSQVVVSRCMGYSSPSDRRWSPSDACHFSLQIRYTGFRDRQPEERHIRFQSDCREGHADIVSTHKLRSLSA